MESGSLCSTPPIPTQTTSQSGFCNFFIVLQLYTCLLFTLIWLEPCFTYVCFSLKNQQTMCWNCVQQNQSSTHTPSPPFPLEGVQLRFSLAEALNISPSSLSTQIQPEFNFLPNMNISKHEHSNQEIGGTPENINDTIPIENWTFILMERSKLFNFHLFYLPLSKVLIYLPHKSLKLINKPFNVIEIWFWFICIATKAAGATA